VRSGLQSTEQDIGLNYTGRFPFTEMVGKARGGFSSPLAGRWLSALYFRVE
jgi:hypothetical protein